MTCRFDRAKSTTFSPRSFLIYASRIFHSRGMVQSKTCGPGRHLVNLQLDVRANRAQGLPDATAGDAAANRIYLRGKGEDCLADVLCDELLKERSPLIHDNS